MLSDQQLKYLESYCVMNGVKYYDLQVEVIDHVAAMIEDVQEKNPSMTFKDALHFVNAQFQKNDFTLMVKNKKKALEKKISILIKKEFVSFFTVPRIFLTVLLFIVAYNIPTLMQENTAVGIAGFLILISPLFYYLIRYRKSKATFNENRNVNLLSLKVKSRYEIISQLSFPAIYFGMNLLRVLGGYHFSKTSTMTMLAIFLIVIAELLYIAILHVRFAFNNKMRQDYPAVFQSAL